MGTKNTIIVPEDFLENQQQISKYFKELASNVATLAKNLNGDISNLDKQYNELMDFTYRVAKAIEKTVPCKRIGMSVIGLEVPHVHVHLIPINTMADMQFMQKVKLSQEEFAALAEKISAHFLSA